MRCVGCNTLLKKTERFNICDTCYSDSIIRVDDDGLIQVEYQLPDENDPSTTAEQWHQIGEAHSNASNAMVANRQRSQADVDFLCKLDMTVREFCAHKVKNNLGDGKFYVFFGYEYPGVDYSKLRLAVREELMLQIQVEEWEWRMVRRQLFGR